MNFSLGMPLQHLYVFTITVIETNTSYITKRFEFQQINDNPYFSVRYLLQKVCTFVLQLKERNFLTLLVF